MTTFEEWCLKVYEEFKNNSDKISLKESYEAGRKQGLDEAAEVARQCNNHAPVNATDEGWHHGCSYTIACIEDLKLKERTSS